ncbi:hyalin-like [Patiria miniata]|uniref:HYR domain-containing protein n=1 Tax=Patiria miniata TaxID=46514 RepID=A0A914BF58_PATMI|nr:hyalin-like [Patiria miniata]
MVVLVGTPEVPVYARKFQALVFDGSSCPPPEANTGNDNNTILAYLPSNVSVAPIYWTNPVLESPPASTLEYIFCEPDPNMDIDIYCRSGDEFPVTYNNDNDGRIKVIYQLVDPTPPDFENGDCVFYIRILDKDAPTITCPRPSNVNENTDAGATTYTLVYSAPEVADNSEGVVWSSDITNGTALSIGPHVVTFTATDTSGNTAECSFTVTVEDSEPPELDCLDSFSITTAVGQPYGVASWVIPTATDNSGDAPVQTANLTSPANLGIGIHTVTYDATDGSDNTASCTFQITVTDEEAPDLSCLTSFSIETVFGLPYGTATWMIPTASDNSGETPVQTANQTSPVNLEIGTYTVTYDATDASGNSAECSFKITVVEGIPLSVTCTPFSLTTDSNKAHATYTLPLNPDVIEHNSGSYTVETTVTTQDGTPVSHTDGQSAQFSYDEVYSVQYCVQDSTTTECCTSQLAVQDDEDPVITCPAAFETATDAGVAYYNESLPAATVTDNSGEDIMYIPEDGPYPLGTNTVTYTATDSSRNSASCTVEVTVKDEERPTILTCIDSIGTTNMGSGVATASYELPTGIDNSGLEVTVQCTPVLGTLLPLGTHTVTCVFRDQAVPVNINLCFITVTVGGYSQ